MRRLTHLVAALLLIAGLGAITQHVYAPAGLKASSGIISDAAAGLITISGSRGATSTGGGGGTAPSYVDSMTVGYWYKLSGTAPDLSLSATNSLDDVVESVATLGNAYGNDGPQSTILGYGGAAVVPTYGTYGAYMPWDGGHAAYYGNALFAFDLGTRTWSRITSSYTGVPAGSWTQSGGVWGDGSPVIPHTLNAILYHPGWNALVTMNLEQSNSYTPTHKPGIYDFDTSSWRYAPTNTNTHPDAIVWAAYCSGGDDIWEEGDSGAWGVSRMNINGGDGSAATYTYFDTIGTGEQDMAVVCTPAGEWDTNELLVMARFYSGSTIRALDTSNPTGGWTDLTQSGEPAVDTRHAWEWSTNKHGIVYWNGGENVYLITKGAGSYGAATYTWTLLTNAGNTTSTSYPAVAGGIYSKGRIATWGTKEVLYAQVTYPGDVYAFRIN